MSASIWTPDGFINAISSAFISFVQNITGAVVRTVQSKLREEVSVLDFGATGDGITDDSSAVQLAINSGRRLYWPAGTYLINVTISTTYNWRGEGQLVTKIKPFSTATPAVKIFYDPSWASQKITDIGFFSSGQLGIGICFGDPVVYTAGIEFAGRLYLSNVLFDGLNIGLYKPYGNIGNVWDNVTYRNCNYGHYAKGNQVGAPGRGLMHTGSDTWRDCEWNDNFKAGCIILDNTVGAGAWTFLGRNTFQFNQGFGLVIDLDLPSFTAFAAISLDNVWYESNGLAGNVTIDSLAGPVTVAAGNERITNDSAMLNYTYYDRTIGLGSTSRVASFNVCSSNRPVMNIYQDYAGNISRSSFFQFLERSSSAVLGSFGFSGTSTTTATFQAAAGSGTFRLINNGSAIVGSGVPAAGVHRINGTSGIGVGNNFLEVLGLGGAMTAAFQPVDSDNSNTAATAIRVGRNLATGRSISAGGTLNASGADTAEYEYKSDGCSKISAGQIIGFDENGQITDKFSKSHSFAVKSTNPHLVGGDTWGVGLEGVELEQARQKVDRIAYSGKVPLNFLGASVGDYIVVEQGESDSIVCRATKQLSLEDYLRSVGKVKRILEDGRAEVIVIIH